MYLATIFFDGKERGKTSSESLNKLDERIDDLLYTLDLEHDQPGVEILIDQI